MSTSTYWFNPDTIIRGDYRGALTMEEFQQSIAQVTELLDTATKQVHVIIDWQATNYPLDIRFIPLAAQLGAHPKFGWMALVGEGSNLSYWLAVARKAAALRVLTFPSIDDAAGFLVRIPKNSIKVE